MSDIDDLKEVCPHCDQLLTLRHINRHLQQVYDDMELDSDLNDDDDDDDDDDDNDESLNLGIDIQEADIQEEELEVAGVDEIEEFGQEDPGDFEVPIPDLEEPLPPAYYIFENPPVNVDMWPDPLPEDPDSDLDEELELELTNEVIDGEDRDPDYIEQDKPPEVDPDDEPRLTDEEMRELLEFDFGDMLDDEWDKIHSRVLTDRDRTTLQFLATRIRTHFSRATWNDLRLGACEDLDLPSEFIAFRRLRILSGLETRVYDSCINSCCCFLGKYKDLDTCPFCQEPRYNARRKPRRTFRYTPLIPQLRGLFQSSLMAKKLRYRTEMEAEYDPNAIYDVFDSENYCRLRQTRVSPDSEYRFFDNPEDIALGLSTDGFTLFKRQRRGHSTAWPMILINYNLDPSVRNHLENVICVGVIPGPKQPKDINSFFIPLLDELIELQEGVRMHGLSPEPEGIRYEFVLHAFIIIIFGDIPAISKLMMIKGHNSFSPCRTCYIEGTKCKLKRTTVYYVPLMAPHSSSRWDHEDLPMRTNAFFLRHYAELRAQLTQGERDDYMRNFGISGEPIFTRLRSIDFPSSFPYDIMHLLFENLVPNMIKHWVGEFKGLDEGNGTYRIPLTRWLPIGFLTAKATRTIPSDFVGTLPDIAVDRGLYKAEAYSFWIQYLALIFLKGVLPEKYYKHLVNLREIILLCLQFKITRPEIDELQTMINDWVLKYEQYYYQYRESRLPTCPLTIHALLHIPYYIRRTGPLWTSWAFVMERFCGRLLPAAKNRIRPYEHLAHYVERRAQLQIVANEYNMPALAKSRLNRKYIGKVPISSHEVFYKDFDSVVLGRPVNKHAVLDDTLKTQMARYFGPVYVGRTQAEHRASLVDESLIRYGRFRINQDGDSFRTAALIDRDPVARDNSYVKYELLPDRNAAFRRRRDDPIREVQYGRLLDIYYVEYIKPDANKTRVPYLLARVEECDTGGLDAARRGTPLVKYSRVFSPTIIHLQTIIAVIGRVSLGGREWAIVDRSRDGVRAEFLDEDGNIEQNLE